MTKDKSPITPKEKNLESEVEQCLAALQRHMQELATSNKFTRLIPEFPLSCLMSNKGFKGYYEWVLARAKSPLNLRALVKQLDAFITIECGGGKDGKTSKLSHEYRCMNDLLRPYLLKYGTETMPTLLPLAVLDMENCFGSALLNAAGITREQLLEDAEKMRNHMENSEEHSDGESDDNAVAYDRKANPTRSRKKFSKNAVDEALDELEDALTKHGQHANEDQSMLEEFAVELVAAAGNGSIEPLIGRQQELESLITILNQKRANNAVILGNEGIGKTALVEGLAWRISRGEVPDSMKGFRIYALNLGAMVAGCELRGAFEKRIQGVIQESVQQGNNILFLDEIHTIIGAGTGRDGLDASNILKPYLSRGELRCIGATTYDEYQKRFITDRAFARRFSKVELKEPTAEETLEIIRGLAPAYEKHHKVKYSEQILEQIVKLSNRYITGRFFPDKAISVMDKCGALYRSGVLRGRKVKPQDVERVVCQAANLPALRADNGDDRKMLADLESNLKKEIYGQDEAVAALVKHIKVAKAGFQDPRKPMLSAFLCGSSGCGKTELARKIAEQLGIAFVKMDMSEYSEEYASSRLIGSAPGYVGYDNPGALTEPVIQTPHCLLLLDEIEKAHRNVFNILLQVLDDGRLTDNKGRVASFKNAIILMTSNAGSRDAAEANDRLGFNLSSTEQSRNRQEIMERTIRKIFPPEFRNRLQCSLMMNDLDHQALCAVVRKSIRNASLLLTEPAVELEISDDAVDYLARQAAAEKMGARPVERLVETQVKQKLVDEILFGALSKGGSVKIGMAPDGTGLSLECCKAARQQVTTG